jgi:hypothetical protein
MDMKTLLYMEARAGKARELVNRIEKLQGLLNQTQSNKFKCIRIAIDSNTVELTRWGSKQVPNDYSSEVEANMLNSFIDVTKAEIKRLEKELAEL